MQTELQQAVASGHALPLMEAFYTIQGEGYHKGSAAFFIRIGGCDVGCHWCDEPNSWKMNAGQKISDSDLVSQLKKIIF